MYVDVVLGELEAIAAERGSIVDTESRETC